MTRSKAEVLQRIFASGVIPILRTPTGDDARQVADVLQQAGMDIVEIPLTVPGALDVIRELSSASSDLIVGAGTVLNIDDVRQVHQAGACFVVTPIFDAAVVGYCREHGLACFAGALTPTEIFTAWQAGADVVKVFPASAVGGPEYLKAVKAPLVDVKLMPTGGVTIENAAAFIAAGAFALGVGGELADTAALRAGQTELIAQRARELLAVVKQARSQHDSKRASY